MREEEINWVYIRNRLRMVTPECFVTEEVIKEVYRMMMDSYRLGVEKGQEKGSELTLRRKNDNMQKREND